MLAAADESVHRPGPEPGWQENYFLLGWDEEEGAGFYLHVERFAAAAEAEVKAAVFRPGRVVSVSEHHPLGPTLDLPGLEWTVDEPMRTVRVRLAMKGREGDEPWLAQAGPGTAPLEIDITTHSRLGAVDWREIFVRLGVPGVVGEHYEVAGAWEGSVTVGDEAVTGGGLFIRDHSWGARDYSSMDQAFWLPMVFDGGEVFVTGATILGDGGWRGFTLVQQEGSVDVVADPVLRLTGHPTPRGYSGATIVALPAGGPPLRLEARVVQHLPVQYPGFAPGHYMNDALCRVEWGERRGFGVVELNTHA